MIARTEARAGGGGARLSTHLPVLLLVASVVACQFADVPKQNADSRDQATLELLKSKRYVELNHKLESIVERYETDPTTERDADLAFDTFFRAGPDLEPLLSNWIAKQPGSYAAFLARGIYYSNVGWSRRGGKYYSETSRAQIEGMKIYFEKSLKDLDRAIAINPRLLHALCYKMEILMNFGAREQIRALRDTALAINPLSLTARWYYITTILPRWGGSIALVQSEIQSTRPYYAKNPALNVLEGRVAAEHGDEALFGQQYLRAAQFYTQALGYGENWFYYNQRGEAYSWGKQIELSNRDFQKALELRPNYAQAQYTYGFNLYSAGRLDDAIKLLGRAVESNPYDHKAFDIRGDAYRMEGKLNLALADFERAVALEPTNQEYIVDLVLVKQALHGK